MVQSNLTSKDYPSKSIHQLTSEVEDFKLFMLIQDIAQGPQPTIIYWTQVSKQVKAMVKVGTILMRMWVVMGYFNGETQLVVVTLE